MAAPKEFGRLLTEAIYIIKAREGNKKISIIQDELGFSLGKEGKSSIEYWRRGWIPSKEEDVETLAREFIQRGGETLGKEWLEKFLTCADYPYIEDLCNELFPIEQTVKAPQSDDEQVASLEASEANHPENLNRLITCRWTIVVAILGFGMLLFFIFYVGSELRAQPDEARSYCGESSLLKIPGGQFLRHEGITLFSGENTPDGILNDRIRSLAPAPEGLLIGYGYNDDEGTPTGGLTYLVIEDGQKLWANCDEAGVTNGKYISAIVVDQKKHIWVASDGDGILRYADGEWEVFNTANSNVPDNRVFGLVVDSNEIVWIATWQGVARFDGLKWTVVYDSENELRKNPVYNIAFDNADNIWIGHVFDGISQFNGSNGQWITYLEEDGDVSGNQVRGIVISEASDTHPESIWFAIDDGGVNKFEEGHWTNFGFKDGLPSDHIRTIAKDFHGRIWVGTDRGVAFFDGTRWNNYHSFSTLSIAFSPGCSEDKSCKDDHVWTGTEAFGLTHSRVPYPTQALDVTEICFKSEGKQTVCPSLDEQIDPHIITATYPITLTPHETFYFNIEVSPRGGYELKAPGDFLSFIGENDDALFGSHANVPVEGIVSPGQRFIFSTHDRILTAPKLPVGINEATFVSPWRVWMHTRYAGPKIYIVFTVQQP